MNTQKTKTIKLLAKFAAGTIALAVMGSAHAHIINIDSRYGFTYDAGGSDPAPLVGQHINLIGSPPVELALEAGTYQITNAAGLPGADFSALNYNESTSAWAWAFVIADISTSNVLLYEEVGFGASEAEVAALTEVQKFSKTFTLSTPTTLYFTLRDYHVADNQGGISLNIDPVSSPVPVPEAIWLFGSVLVGYMSFAKRKN